MTTATFAVLKKVFSDPDLPESWREKKDLAYGNAYLRAAIQAYRVGDYRDGQSALSQAIQLDPDLSKNESTILAKRLSALADSPKAIDKLEFLERIYRHLPKELSVLQHQRRKNLSQAAVELGFSAYQGGELRKARALLRRAIRYQPRWLANLGILSILLKSSLLPWKKPDEGHSVSSKPTKGKVNA